MDRLRKGWFHNPVPVFFASKKRGSDMLPEPLNMVWISGNHSGFNIEVHGLTQILCPIFALDGLSQENVCSRRLVCSDLFLAFIFLILSIFHLIDGNSPIEGSRNNPQFGVPAKIESKNSLSDCL